MPRENRSKTTGFRATPAERKLIDNQAKKLNLRLSEYVRLCVLSDIANRQKAQGGGSNSPSNQKAAA